MAISTFGFAVWNGVIDEINHTRHRHNEIELNFLKKGYLTYLIGGYQITVQEGEIAAFWAAIPHQAIYCPPDTHIYWGTLPLEYVLQWELPQTFLKGLLSGTLFKSRSMYTDQFFQQWAKDIVFKRRTIALMEIQALLHRIALDIGQHADVAEESLRFERSIDHRVNVMARYIIENFQEQLTVNDIARQVGLHPNYVMTIFKELFGTTLIDYLTQQRIAYAQQLLITTDFLVSRVAEESGFLTLSHFFGSFKRLCGMTPRQYRAKLR
ncbi:MAG: AraC family transcriptional regulator [Aggregatilineales bacterium]